jgi:hypothetical protein
MSFYGHCYRDAKTSKHPPEWVTEFVVKEDGTIKTFKEFMEASVLPELHEQAHHQLSLYSVYLERWFKLFDRKKIMVLNYSELKTDPQDALKRIHDFLEIPMIQKSLPSANSWHADGEDKPSCETQDTLNKAFEPFNQKLYELLEAQPGPVQETRPFPKFQYSCKV